MSKKRTSIESSDVSQANEDSEHDANFNTAQLDPMSDTSLQDLPAELLQCILVKVVAMEVKSLRLAKSVWKEKADLIISRLRAVSSQWSNVLSTDFFRTEIHRTLDDTAENSIRLEVLQESPIKREVHAITTANEELYTIERLSAKDDAVTIYAISVYNRSNMAEKTDVLQLGMYMNAGSYPWRIRGCSTSNCLYLVMLNETSPRTSILRISKTAEHQYTFTPWLSDHERRISQTFISKGSLILISVQRELYPNVVSIYDAAGSLQQEITFSIDAEVSGFYSIIQKSNGNLVVADLDDESTMINLREIDASGSVVRQYESSSGEESCAVHFADDYDRIMICTAYNGIELLDREFNLLGIYRPEVDEGKDLYLEEAHYDEVRNEVVRFYCAMNYMSHAVTFFRFTEE